MMRERIKELLTKCNYPTDGTCDLTREEKLTKLIIEEVIKVGKDEFTKDHSILPIFPAHKIRQHFGVD
jgi:hypothetical protein